MKITAFATLAMIGSAAAMPVAPPAARTFSAGVTRSEHPETRAVDLLGLLPLLRRNAEGDNGDGAEKNPEANTDEGTEASTEESTEANTEETAEENGEGNAEAGGDGGDVGDDSETTFEIGEYIEPAEFNQKDWDWWHPYIGMTDEGAFDMWDHRMMSLAGLLRTLGSQKVEFQGPFTLRGYRREVFLDAKHKVEGYVGVEPESDSAKEEYWWNFVYDLKQKLVAEAEEKKNNKEEGKEAGKADDEEAGKEQPQEESEEEPKEEPKEEPTEEPKEEPKEKSKEQPKESVKAGEEPNAVKFVYELTQKLVAEAEEKKKNEEEGKEAGKADDKEAGKEQPQEESKEEPKEESKEQPKESVKAGEEPNAETAQAAAAPPADGAKVRRAGSTLDLADVPPIPPPGNWDRYYEWVGLAVSWRSIARREQDAYARLGLVLEEAPMIPAGGDWNSMIIWTESARVWQDKTIQAVKDFEAAQGAQEQDRRVIAQLLAIIQSTRTADA